MSLIKNIQFQQLINLLLLLIIAQSNNTLQISWFQIAILAIFATFTELAILKVQNKALYLPYSAIITSFGIILMIGWFKWYIPYILTALSLVQKKFLTIQNRHIFNPSNFAVVIALLLFYPKALPIIGQIGYQGYFIVIAVIILATLILIRVNRLTISVIFAISYIALEYLVIGASEPTWQLTNFLDKFYTTSFIVYIFFMLTDPLTTPDSIKLQALFGVVVSAILVSLDYFVGIRVWNLFLALFLTSIAFIPLYRKLNQKEWQIYISFFILALLTTLYISSKTPHYFSM